MVKQPQTRVLWKALRIARLGRDGRAVIWRHIRRETAAGTPLGALLLASGAIE